MEGGREERRGGMEMGEGGRWGREGDGGREGVREREREEREEVTKPFLIWKQESPKLQ
jgi:hypothetical protein